MGEICTLLCGNFRQILPVIQHGTRTNIVNSCLKRSYLWDHVLVKTLQTNMRVHLCWDDNSLGFNDNFRQKLLDHQKKQDGVMIAKCEIKQARSGDKLEVMLSKQSEISDCTDTFDISEVEDKISQLTNLHDLPEYSRVSVRIKVLDVADPHTMQGGKTTQNVVIADRTSRTKFTLWEEHVGKLQKDKSYHLKYMLLRIYGGESYLATPKNDSDIMPIEDIDIGNIDLTCTEDTTLPNIINNVKMVAIDTLTRSDGCIQCGHSISTVTEEEEFGECTKCGLLQCREECKSNLAAHFTIKTLEGERLNFYAYNQTVANIAEREPCEVTKLSILKSKPFSIQHSKNTIHSITRI